MVQPIHIGGLREFNRALRKLDRELPKAVRLAFNEAADIVVQDARPRVPQRTGRAARSIRAVSTRTQVRVAAGGARVPYYPWLDFGGRVGRKKSVHRPFLKEGRYLYKSYFAKRDSGEFQRAMAKALSGVAEHAGFRVT